MSSEAALPATTESEVREALRVNDVDGAATRAIQGYGPELFGFIVALVRDHDAAEDVFSEVCETLWRGLPGFRWESSLRTWAYTLTRHACSRHLHSGYRRKRTPLSAAQHLLDIEVQVRTETLTFLKTQTKTAIQRLRDELSPEERALLILRIDRQLAWNDIALISRSASNSSELEAGELSREAAVLRKRFERAKERLRQLAQREGLLDRDDD